MIAVWGYTQGVSLAVCWRIVHVVFHANLFFAGKSLIRQLLTTNPEKRTNIDKFMNNPWVSVSSLFEFEG